MTAARHHLPARIVAMMLGTMLIFLVTLALSLGWMARALDHEAHDHDLEQVENAQDRLLSEMRVLLLDYAKWEAAMPRVRAADIGWIGDNIGVSAETGFSFQLAVLWGGPFAADIGWRDDDDLAAPRAGLLDPGLRRAVEAQLRRIPLNVYRGTEFFAWYGGALYVMGAARFEPDAPGAVANLVSRDSATPRLLLGRRLDVPVIRALGETYLLDGLRVVRTPRPGQHAYPLRGADGGPVAYLTYEVDHVGTQMLGRMALPLALVILVGIGLASFATVLVRRNAAQLVLAERRASSAARTDPLTGLPNRAAFSRTLADPAKAGERAILFLDVNGFKRINDTIGHAAGDEVIVAVASRLVTLTAPDCGLARIAGDEFVFVVNGANAAFRAEWLAHAVRRSLARPVQVRGRELKVSMAIGYAVQDVDDMPGEDLVRHADLAMYEAKRQKAGTAVAFGAVIEEAMRDAALIERGLRQAIERPDELSVVYQPIVDRQGRMVRAEALARWTSAELGQVPPDRFIAIAEQAGLIVPLGRRLLHRVCEDLRTHPDLRVSINLSPLELAAPDYVPGLVRELEARGLAPSRVEVELTEAVVVEDPHLAAERLGELRAAGFSTALDDFGSGYSSVGYLRQLPFDTLKIDRHFVSALGADPHDDIVLDAMVNLALGLGFEVVAEGVETAEQLAKAHAFGANLTQGYLFDRPLPIDRLMERWAQRLQVEEAGAPLPAQRRQPAPDRPARAPGRRFGAARKA